MAVRGECGFPVAGFLGGFGRGTKFGGSGFGDLVGLLASSAARSGETNSKSMGIAAPAPARRSVAHVIIPDVLVSMTARLWCRSGGRGGRRTTAAGQILTTSPPPRQTFVNSVTVELPSHCRLTEGRQKNERFASKYAQGAPERLPATLGPTPGNPERLHPSPNSQLVTPQPPIVYFAHKVNILAQFLRVAASGCVYPARAATY